MSFTGENAIVFNHASMKEMVQDYLDKITQHVDTPIVESVRQASFEDLDNIKEGFLVICSGKTND